MKIRTAHDLAYLIAEARRKLGWSQNRLAERVGVSRQWISLVENGKTSVEFDLVLGSLQALGYTISVDSGEPTFRAPRLGRHAQGTMESPGHPPSNRTPLTRHGKPLGDQRSRRRKSD